MPGSSDGGPLACTSLVLLRDPPPPSRQRDGQPRAQTQNAQATGGHLARLPACLPACQAQPAQAAAMMVLLAYTLAIWAIGLLGSLAPLGMASYNKIILACCNSFAAGVMLSAGACVRVCACVCVHAKSVGWPVSRAACRLAGWLAGWRVGG